MASSKKVPNSHISSGQLKDLWGITNRQLQQHIKHGLPRTRIGGRYFYSTAQVEPWIRENRPMVTWPECFHDDGVPHATQENIEQLLLGPYAPKPKPEGPQKSGPKPLPEAARRRLEQEQGQFVLPPNPTKEDAQIFASITRARLVELKIAEIESRLVDRQEALDLISGMVKNLRKLLMAIPEQVAHEVAVASDPRETRRVIDEAIRACLNTLVENPELLAAPSEIDIEEERD